MPQSHDVMIDGAGYMIVPGSYRYASTGADLTAVRTGVPSFGQPLAAGGPVEMDRDAARWRALGMMPIPVGLGDGGGRLVLGPKELAVVLGLGVNFDGNSRAIIYNGVVYFTAGANLFKLVTAGGAWSTVAFVGATTAAVTGMCVSGGLLYLAEGAAANMQNYAGVGALVNAPAVKGQTTWDYARGLWRSKQDAVTLAWDTASGTPDGGATWFDFRLDSDIRSAVVWRGRATGGGTVLIGTKQMLWELAGQWTGAPAVWSGTVSPLYDTRGGGGSDDFAYLVEYQGDAYTWYAGSVHRWDGTHLAPMAGGPRGLVTGMCVAGGALCVSVFDAATTRWSVYQYDGVRWGQVEISATAPYQALAGTGGLVSDGHLIALVSGTQTISRWQMPVTGLTGQPRASGQVIAGPLDAGVGDAIKTWTEIRVAWSTALYPAGTSAPANPGGGLLLEYSIDDGSNWVSLGTTTIAAAARAGLVIAAVPSGGVQANRLLVRATWTPTSAYAAFQIDGVWASGWAVGDVPKKETWRFRLKITDKLIKRDGSVDARSGETMLQALRSLAQSGRTFVFNDIDQDLVARSVTCRVEDLIETERKGDGVHFLESQVDLTITAVA